MIFLCCVGCRFLSCVIALFTALDGLLWKILKTLTCLHQKRSISIKFHGIIVVVVVKRLFKRTGLLAGTASMSLSLSKSTYYSYTLDTHDKHVLLTLFSCTIQEIKIIPRSDLGCRLFYEMSRLLELRAQDCYFPAPQVCLKEPFL